MILTYMWLIKNLFEHSYRWVLMIIISEMAEVDQLSQRAAEPLTITVLRARDLVMLYDCCNLLDKYFIA